MTVQRGEVYTAPPGTVLLMVPWRVDHHGWGEAIGETLDERVASRAAQKAANIQTEGAFRWTDPRTMPVDPPWSPNR